MRSGHLRFGHRSFQFAGVLQVLLLAAIPMFLLSTIDSYLDYAACSFGVGVTETSLAVGITFTYYWYQQWRQGIVLGIFGAGAARPFLRPCATWIAFYKQAQSPCCFGSINKDRLFFDPLYIDPKCAN